MPVRVYNGEWAPGSVGDHGVNLSLRVIRIRDMKKTLASPFPLGVGRVTQLLQNLGFCENWQQMNRPSVVLSVAVPQSPGALRNELPEYCHRWDPKTLRTFTCTVVFIIVHHPRLYIANILLIYTCIVGRCEQGDGSRCSMIPVFFIMYFKLSVGL